MFVVCHILTSLDGKISGDFFESSETMKAVSEYGKLRSFYNCEATLYGTTTMGEFIGVNEHDEIGEPHSLDDYVLKDTNYVVAIDTKGKLNYSSGKYIRHGNSSQIIAVLTEQVSEKRLEQLRELGVSYIIAGKTQLDVKETVNKLENLFGIRKLMIAGGGYIDWTFLKDDMIDEVSLVIAPSADGFKDTPSLFMKSEDDGTVKDFELINVEKITDNAVWLRYMVVK